MPSIFPAVGEHSGCSSIQAYTSYQRGGGGVATVGIAMTAGPFLAPAQALLTFFVLWLCSVDRANAMFG